MAAHAGLPFDPLCLAGLGWQARAPQFRAPAAGLAAGAAAIALDGKTLRGSLDRFEDRKAARVLGVFATEERTVRGRILIEEAGKDHEIRRPSTSSKPWD